MVRITGEGSRVDDRVPPRPPCVPPASRFRVCFVISLAVLWFVNQTGSIFRIKAPWLLFWSRTCLVPRRICGLGFRGEGIGVMIAFRPPRIPPAEGFRLIHFCIAQLQAQGPCRNLTRGGGPARPASHLQKARSFFMCL